MAKVLCGLIMCQHNFKNTPQGLGTCMCKEKVRMKYDDNDKSSSGSVVCNNFVFLQSKCSHSRTQVQLNKEEGLWEVV